MGELLWDVRDRSRRRTEIASTSTREVCVRQYHPLVPTVNASHETG